MGGILGPRRRVAGFDLGRLMVLFGLSSIRALSPLGTAVAPPSVTISCILGESRSNTQVGDVVVECVVTSCWLIDFLPRSNYSHREWYPCFDRPQDYSWLERPMDWLIALRRVPGRRGGLTELG